MESIRAGQGHNGRWLTLFGLLLCVCVATAVSVFAVTPARGAEEPPSLAEVPAPSASELAEAEREEREHAEWLSSPEAQKQRDASSNAYANLTAGEAQSLLVEAFPGQLKALNADPARVLSTLEVEKPLGTYGALVSNEEGESAILDSSVPVQSELGGEGKEPVDLALEQSGSSFVPQNPITEVELPGSAEEPVQLESGVEVELPASDDHGAVPLGAMNLFYPETETATDTLVSPKASGVEVFEQLRSPESPERFNFTLQLPNEATLRPSEAGGAEIVSSSGETIGEVPPPSATDAQGATVPVTTTIEGDSLILEVSHRSGEVAYPLLLDPEYVNDTTSFGEWSASLNSGYEYYLNNNWSSLDAISRGNYFYAANTHGQWAWGAYGSTGYIAAATFSPVDYIVHTCQTYDPHGYIGLYNPGSGGYDALGIWATWSSEGPYETGWRGGTGTRDAIIGIGTGGTGVKIGCAHELYVGGYSIQEKDPEAPTVNWVGGTSGSWVKEITVTPHVSDPGLGVKAITLSPEGASPQTNSQGCAGANGSRCPGSWETSFGTSYFLEGERGASVTAYDPLGPDVSSHVSSSYQFTTRLDRQKPEVKLEGEFTEALEEAKEEGEGQKAPALHLPVYNLRIDATDKANEGNPKTEPKARRSGIKNIAVFLDKKEMKAPWSAQGCSGPEYSCPMEKIYPVPMDEVEGGGVHEIEVIAEDQVGNKREETKYFEYFPATGMKDEYVMQHFPLPDGEGNEEEEEHPNRPELAVNVTNGNLVYRQKDVEVNGPNVDLEVERFYNSQLPPEDNTEWGDGWTLAQTPELEPEETKEKAPPAKASMVRTSGALESTVGLPTESGATQFDKKLQAVVAKEPGGGYTVEDQSGETDGSLAFNSAGKVTELQTPGYAKVDYSYEGGGGDLSEIAVNDPASTSDVPEESPEPPKTPVFAGSTGSSGSGNGQFGYPQGIASDAQGDIYVTDTTNNRVEKLDSAGKYLSQFGSAGSGNGQFSSPNGVAVGAKGDVYVADSGNRRIERFSATGEYVGKFGSQGTGSGQFSSGIGGIATDAAGGVWASDYADHRIEHFSAEGEYLGQITDSHMSSPRDIAIGADGSLWVVDLYYERVEEFNAAGEYISAIGGGDFSWPQGIAVDSTGDVWVVDSEDNRVVELDPQGNVLTQFGKGGSGEGQFEEPTGLALEPNGDFLVLDTYHHRVEKWILQAVPVVSSDAASAVGETTATLNATVDPRGLDTHYSFEYGITSSYGTTVPASPEDVGSGAEGVKVSQTVKGLKPWVIYHYRLLATNAEGTTYGKDEELTTQSEWTLESPPSPKAASTSYLSDVSCPSTSVCLAVGHSSANEGESLAEAWNGKEWSLINYAKGRSPIDVSCQGTVCWVVGTQGSANEVLVERYEYEEWGEGESEWWGGLYTAHKPIVPEGAANLHLNAISCTSASECTAVGYYEKSGKHALAEHLTSTGWSLQTTPALTGAVLEDVSCTAATSCTAVGYREPNGWQREPLAERLSGSEWSALGVKAPPLSENSELKGYEEEEKWEYGWLTSVSCASSTSCLATGTYRNIEWEQFPLAQVYGGTEFSLTSLPKLSQGSTLEDVSCASSVSCLAAGHNATGAAALALSYNGKEWATQAAITPKGKTAWLAGVACPEALVCTAVGKSEGGGEVATLAERIEPRNQKATTESATDVTREAASLGATVNPHSLDTHYSFEYGLTKHYGSSTASKDAGSGIQDVTASASISGLEPGRLYHYRVVATSEIGTTDGEDRTFTTPPPTFAFDLGAEEEGEGHLAVPGGVVTDAAGNVYVSDPGNHRVAKFSPTGEYLSEFGETGSGNGQFGEGIGPIAVGPEGDVYVADPAHHRVERFDASGEYVSQLGSEGTGNGQFGTVIGGIAVDQAGVVWVSDSSNHRVERFNAKGEYLGKLGSEGTGYGQFASPRAIAIDPSRNAWVVDLGHERIEEFNASGSYLRQTGKAGKGNGELTSPAGVATDAAGNLWVVDSGNTRLEEFDAKGQYLSQFGGASEGEGQLDEPAGLAIDPQGSLLIANLGSSQVQKWFVQPGDASSEEGLDKEDDPKVEVETSAGLVESVGGKDAGQTTYSHNGETLTAVAGPKGETKYEYDSAERLTKVTLPNGTWGEVKYDEFGRVKAVTVSAEGAKAKTTFFSYKDEPRRTTVSPEGQPITVYDIAPDGSVLKWWNKQEPPEIENLSGSLYVNKETEKAIEPGDYELLVQAHSVEGIAKIDIIANGNQLVDEKTCEQNYENEVTECQTVEDPWVTETGSWPPGILYLEVIVTDSVEGTETVPNTESSKFWVNIPYTPPPDPEADEPPKFSEVLRFREEFGLDLDLKGNELAIDERIFDLIGAWNNPHTPAGEVARATDERWGVPLRAVDAAELEYREQYTAHDIPLLDAWASATYPGSYAGVYVDERSGGVIRIGFTSGQSSSVDAAQQLSGLLAPRRIAGFASAPAYSLANLSGSQSAIAASLPSSPEGLIVSTGIEVEANRILIGATNVAEASSWLTANFGAEAPILVEYEESAPVPMSTRRKISGPLYAGDLLVTTTGGTCSAGFGAMQKLADGKERLFALTAAHCFQVGDNVRRENGAGKTASIGSAKRSGHDAFLKDVTADTVAVGLNGSVGMPRYINQGRGAALPVKALSTMPHSGKYLCHAGYGSDPTGTKSKLCGKVRNGRWFYESKNHGRAEVLFCFGANIHGGDSGGPVWIRGTHTVVGLATHGRGIIAKEEERETCATALLPSVVEGKNLMPEDAASLTNSKLRPLTLVYAP